MSTNTNRYSPLFAISSRILGQQTSRPLPSAGTDPNFIQSHPYNAQLARRLSEGLSLQESTEIIQLTNHPPTLFNLSHFFKGYDPGLSHIRPLCKNVDFIPQLGTKDTYPRSEPK